MAKCPVCNNELGVNIPDKCKKCGWDTGHDINLVTSLNLPERDIVIQYNYKLKKAIDEYVDEYFDCLLWKIIEKYCIILLIGMPIIIFLLFQYAKINILANLITFIFSVLAGYIWIFGYSFIMSYPTIWREDNQGWVSVLIFNIMFFVFYTYPLLCYPLRDKRHYINTLIYSHLSISLFWIVIYFIFKYLRLKKKRQLK